jgi:ABC-type glycerol-3-phosphate transport system permease component
VRFLQRCGTNVWKLNRFISKSLLYVLTAAVMVWILFPFYWMVNSSFTPTVQLFRYPPVWLQTDPTLEHWKWAMNPRFLRPLVNSVTVAIMTVAISTPVSALAAYGLARYRIPGKTTLTGLFVATQMIPGVLLVIPLFLAFSQLKLVNTHIGLALAYATFIFPFNLLQLRAFFLNFPLELEDAAMVDGCSRLGAFLRITLPLSVPGVLTAALLSVVVAWNDLLFSLILTLDIQATTAAVQIYNLSKSQFASTNWGGIIAEATILTLPVVIMFVFLQTYLVQGLTAGAIKG